MIELLTAGVTIKGCSATWVTSKLFVSTTVSTKSANGYSRLDHDRAFEDTDRITVGEEHHEVIDPTT